MSTANPNRRPLSALLAVLLACAAFLVAPGTAQAGTPAAPTRTAPAPTPASAQALNTMFATYGDTSGRWNGGDSTVSVPLPDGRVAWLFSDTFLGPVNPDGSRPDDNKFVHNSLVVQSGDALTRTLTGGTPAAPLSLVGGERDGERGNAGYWVAGGAVEGRSLRVLYNRYRHTGTGSLDIALAGNALATFALPSLALTSLRDLPLGSTTAWGQSILRDGVYDYVYGTEFAGQGRYAHLARAAADRLGGAWEFWNGTGWSTREADSARLLGASTPPTRWSGRAAATSWSPATAAPPSAPTSSPTRPPHRPAPSPTRSRSSPLPSRPRAGR
ncbi:hypothetical protein ABT160_32625 [Streptomyces sp. NPDC001941]|uniref:hypothetical protein n=1 Tax=Streptomyces sp. NPDC001941 TaxID=3154659 RepID=UPI00332E88FB